MNMSKNFRTRSAIGKSWYLFVALCMSFVPVRGQMMYEITPLVGFNSGGTLKLSQPPSPNIESHLADSVSYGLAAGLRWESSSGEGHDGVEFRWMRRDTNLFLNQGTLAPPSYTTASFRPNITLNQYLGDFTHEFDVQESPHVLPFLTLTLGVTNLSAPASAATRFAFGIGAGVKVFPTLHYGFRLKVEYLGSALTSGAQNLLCSGGSCILILNNGVMNQFELTLGPAFRF
jgi:hypothetical protein